jgi:hypothetical protein
VLHGQAGVPLTVSWYDKPGGRRRRGTLERNLEGLLIGRPVNPLVDVHRVVLPVFVRPVEPFAEASPLFGRADVQHDLDHGGVIVDELLLERVDLVVACGDLRRRGEFVHAGDQHVLVVRTVEHADHSGRRELLADTPEKIMPELRLGGRLETKVTDSLRVDPTHHVSHDSSLPGRVHGLQQEKKLAAIPTGAVCKEHLLQVREGAGRLISRFRRVFFRTVEARCGPRVDRCEAEAGGHPQRVEGVFRPETSAVLAVLAHGAPLVRSHNAPTSERAPEPRQAGSMVSILRDSPAAR